MLPRPHSSASTRPAELGCDRASAPQPGLAAGPLTAVGVVGQLSAEAVLEVPLGTTSSRP